MYAMLSIHPDIAYAVAWLCQFQSNPTKQHLKAAKHILQYLCGTFHLRLYLGHNDNHDNFLVGYTDVDFAGDLNNSLSTFGWCYYLGRGVVCWSLHKQNSIANSTFDLEYYATHEACKQLKWLAIFAKQAGHPFDISMKLHYDNKSTVDASVASNMKHHSKHTHIRAHSVYECIQDGLIELVRILSVNNPADIFTKSLPTDIHACYTLALGLILYHLAKGEY